MCDTYSDPLLSHRITPRTVYTMDGTDYPTQQKAIAAREDKINAIVREMTKNFMCYRPAEIAEMTEFLIENRQKIAQLLDY